jgi:hypothetical protein
VQTDRSHVSRLRQSGHTLAPILHDWEAGRIRPATIFFRLSRRPFRDTLDAKADFGGFDSGPVWSSGPKRRTPDTPASSR